MEIMNKKLKPSIYVIIDPAMNQETLLNKLKIIVKEDIAAIQVWNHFKENRHIEDLLSKIEEISKPYQIPIIINNQWKYLQKIPLHGVHFDEIPENFEEIKKKINKPFICGITCNNDISIIKWASENNLDYISFCSMFPSKTANSCELVNFETVHLAKEIFNGYIFLAGGINPENINSLIELNYDGIAVISGIMNSENPSESIKKYNLNIKKNEN